MSVGLGIIKAVISSKQPFSDIVESGIDDTFLEGAEKEVYEFVKTFKYKHNQYPQIKTIEAEVPKASFQHLPEEPVEYWASELRERKRFWILSDAQSKISTLLQKGKVSDAQSTLKESHDALLRINQEFTVEDLAKIQEDVLNRHDEIQQTAGIAGIPYGYRQLDNLTYGQQKGDFNVVIGQTGSCKSYFCIGTAKAAHNAGYNVMIISPEMPPQQIARRVLAMQMKVPDGSIRKGRLSYYAVQKARKLIHEPISIEDETIDNWFKILPSGLYSDVNSLVSIAGEYKPDLLVVDGFYMLKDMKVKSSAGWQQDESVIYTLKNFALHSDIPILASTQYNRAKPGKLEGAKGSQAVEHTASNFFSLEFENPADRESQSPIQFRDLKVKKSRDGDSMVLKFKFDFQRTTIEEISYDSQGPEFNDDEYISEL